MQSRRPTEKDEQRPHVPYSHMDERDEDLFYETLAELLTLLPFKGGIVTDGKTVHQSRRPIPSALGLIARQARWEVPHGARAAPHGHARPSLPLASAGKTRQAVAENERMPVRPG